MILARPGDDPSDQAPRPWWSLGKTVLAACALALWRDGAVDLDAPLPGRPYTLAQLLQHRAGLPDYFALPAYHAAVARGDAPWDADALLDRAGPLLHAPGAGWRYSNVGYLIARQRLEQVAPLAELIDRILVRPLGLAWTRLALLPSDLDGVAGVADGYHPGWVYPGLVTGPPAEAARVLDAILHGDLLGPAARARMTARHPVGGALPDRPWRTHGYGLGLMMGEMAGAGPVAGHSGGGPGSFCAVYAARGHTVAAFDTGASEAAPERAVAAALAAATGS